MARIVKDVTPAAAPLAKKTRVAAYARVSCGKDEMLHSLAAQVSFYSGMIQNNPGWEYIGVYADEALTGTVDSRPEFQRLVADCRAGFIDIVITKSISRFARNTVTLLATVRELKNLGIDVFFEEQNIHSISGEGELMLTILAGYAQEESRSTSENCKWRIRKSFERGKMIGFTGMYGYNYSNGIITINEEQAAVIRQIFKWYIGGAGSEKIAKRLNKKGVPTYHGGRWSGSRIADLMQNEKLTGNALLQKEFCADHLTKRKVKNRGELPSWYVEDTHPAIIPIEIFEEALYVRQKRAEHFKAADSGQNKYPYTGKIVCGLCGCNYRRKVVQGRHYWQCGTFLTEGRKSCPAQQVPERILDGFAMEFGGMKNIMRIVVPGPNQLTFHLLGGLTKAREWHISRRDSWTDEMKQKARETALKRGEQNG